MSDVLISALAHVLQLAHDAGDHVVELVFAHGAFLQGDLQRAAQLVALERCLAAIALHDDQVAQLDTFEGGEPAAAVRAATPPAYGGVFFSRPAVLHD